MILPWTWKCSSLFKILILFPADIYSEVRLLHYYGSSVVKFWKDFYTIVSVQIYILINSVWGSSFSTSCRHLLPLIYLVKAILIDVRWFLLMVWFAFPACVIIDAEHVFVKVLTIYILFGLICFQVLCPFLINLFMFLLLSWMSSLYFWILAPYGIYSLQGIFFHSIGFFFIWLIISFSVLASFFK